MDNNIIKDLEYRLDGFEKNIVDVKNAANDLLYKYQSIKDQPLTDPLHVNSKRVIKNTVPLFTSVFLAGSDAATSSNYNAFWVADSSYVITSVTAFYSTASTSGTVNLYKTVSGTAIGSGTAILSSAISTSGTANTVITGSLKKDTSINLKQGDVLGLVSGGTLTSLANLSITVNLTLL